MQSTSTARAEASKTSIAIVNAGSGNVEVRVGLAVDLSAFEAFAREHDIRKAAVDAFFATLERENVPLEDAERRLREIAKTFLRTRERLQEFHPNPEVAILLGQAKELLEDGCEDKALALLKQIESQADVNLNALEAKLNEQKRQKAKIAITSGEIFVVKLDHINALDKFNSALDLWPDRDLQQIEILTLKASVERELGKYSDAIASAEMAITAMGEWADAETRLLRFDAYVQLAEANLAIADHTSALDANRRARESLGNHIGEDQDVSLRAKRAAILIDAGLLEQAQVTLDGLHEPTTHIASIEFANLSFALGRLFVQKRNWAQADKMFLVAIDAFADSVPALYPDGLRARREAAFVALNLGQFERAEELLEQAYSGFKSVFGGESHPEFVTLLDQKGILELERGDLAASKQTFETAIALSQFTHGDKHPDWGQLINNYGKLLLNSGHHNEALEVFSQAYTVFENALGDRHHELAAVALNLSSGYLHTARIRDAEKYAELSRQIALENFGAGHLAVVEALVQMSSVKLAAGDLDGARKAAEEAEKDLETIDRVMCGTMATAKVIVSKCYLAENAFEQALLVARDALTLARRALRPEPGKIPAAAYNLGEILHARGQLKRAFTTMSAGLKRSRSDFKGYHESTVTGLVNVGGTAAQLGDKDFAKKALTCAVVQGREVWPEGGMLTAIALNGLARLKEDTANKTETEALYQEAIEILSHTLGRKHPHSIAVKSNFDSWRKGFDQ